MGQNLLSLTPPTYFHRIKTTQPRWSAPPATNVTVLPSPASAPAEHAGYKYRASGPLCRRWKAINLHEISPRTTPALNSTYIRHLSFSSSAAPRLLCWACKPAALYPDIRKLMYRRLCSVFRHDGFPLRTAHYAWVYIFFSHPHSRVSSVSFSLIFNVLFRFTFLAWIKALAVVRQNAL